MKEIIKEILSDLQVELTEKFDLNFSRGGFFGSRWKPKSNQEASHLIKRGALRRSIRSRIAGNSIIFTSSKPYAGIHNEGGKITVTPKMKRFFWAKAYEAAGKTFTKKGNRSNSRKATVWNRQAEMYRRLALMKVGSKITIPQRKFIGEYAGLTKTVERAAQRAIKAALNEIIKTKK